MPSRPTHLGRPFVCKRSDEVYGHNWGINDEFCVGVQAQVQDCWHPVTDLLWALAVNGAGHPAGWG